MLMRIFRSSGDPTNGSSETFGVDQCVSACSSCLVCMEEGRPELVCWRRTDEFFSPSWEEAGARRSRGREMWRGLRTSLLAPGSRTLSRVKVSGKLQGSCLPQPPEDCVHIDYVVAVFL